MTPFPLDPHSQRSAINTVKRYSREAEGDTAAVTVNTKDLTSIQNMVNKTAETYGRLDVLVYNSGTIWWASVEETPMRRFQLMQQVNPESLHGTIQAVLLHFEANG